MADLLRGGGARSARSPSNPKPLNAVYVVKLRNGVATLAQTGKTAIFCQVRETCIFYVVSSDYSRNSRFFTKFYIQNK